MKSLRSLIFSSYIASTVIIMLMNFDGAGKFSFGPTGVKAIVKEFKKSCDLCTTYGFVWCAKTTNPFIPSRCAE